MNSLNTYKKNIEIQKPPLEKKVKIIALLRAILFILSVVFLVMSFSNSYYYLIAFTIVTIVFILCMIIHAKYFNKLETIRFKLSSISDFESRRNNKWRNFTDTGNDLKDSDNFFESDLDVFGKNSLFQYICLSKTPYGRYELSQLLKDIDTTNEEILERQEAVLEFSEDLDKHLNLSAVLKKYEKNGNDVRKNSMDNALNLLENKVSFQKWYWILPIFSLLIFIAVVIFIIQDKLSAGYILVPIILNLFSTELFVKEMKEVQSNLLPINNQFIGFNKVVKVIVNEEYKSKKLVEYQNQTKNLNNSAFVQFTILNSIITTRRNFLFKLLLNSVIILDPFILYAYKKWNEKHSTYLKDAFTGIGKIESLLSMSVIGLSKDNKVVPTFTTNITFENLMHPLIEESSCVGNDFDFIASNIITGSNMSGKTTFMRSIGINYLLFKAGSCVCATSFSAGMYKLFTSMKVTDDISNGISTFYGEILRIKNIVDYIATKKPMLVLIDEIFKGTNTKDRIEGAKAVLSKLHEENILSIITTHDYELCEADNVRNYFFLEHYDNDKILFNYKINEGKSTTRNAIYLLKMAGIIT
ncbi:MAG: MutS-related protein [Anaeroplasmataceae bacterium]